MPGSHPIDACVFDQHEDGALLLRVGDLSSAQPAGSRLYCSYANPAARSLLGLAAMPPDEGFDCLAADDQATLVQCLQQVMASGQPASLRVSPRDPALPPVEMRMLRNGEQVLALLRTTPPPPRAAEELAGARLDALLAHAPLAIVLLDPQGRIGAINPPALRLFGWRGPVPPDGLSALPAPARAAVETLLQQVLSNGAATVGEIPATPDTAGMSRPWWATCFPLRQAADGVGGVGLVARELVESEMATEILHYVEDRFHAFMDNCPAAAYIKDRAGRIVWVNAFVERYFKQPAEYWVGRSAVDLFPPDEAAQVEANDLAVLDSGEAMSFFETVSHAGRKDHYLSFKFPIHEPSAHTQLLGGMSVNVNKQIETQEEIRRLNDELRARENELQTLLDLVPMAIYTAHDAACSSVSVNRAAMELVSGSAPGEFWTRLAEKGALGSLRVYRGGRELSLDELPLRYAAEGGEIRGDEYQLRLADGSIKHVFCYAAPLRDGKAGIQGSITAFLDVSEPIQARQRLETMFNSNLIGNISWKLDGTITSANDVFLASVGYSREDLQAGRMSWQALTPPEYSQMDRMKLEELARHRFHTPYEKEYFHRDGRRVPVLVSTAFFPDSADEGISYIVDLSEVKRAEQRIRDLLTQVTTASNAKDNFLATLAHELRNPLAPIRNSVHSLKLKGIQDPQVVWMLDIVDRQVGHMARMLEDLLDVARIARDKLSLRTEVLELTTVIEAAVETSRPLIDARRHRLSLEFPTRPLLLYADPVRLSQVFANILNNAAKYTPEAGLLSVSVHVEADGEHVNITIRDNGIGISSEVLPQVFDLFSQAQPALEHAQGGLGIGLSLVKGLVELHGGTVTARSDGQRGSEFTVRLPLLAQAPETDSLSAAPGLPQSSFRVLVVDDNADSADSLAALLMLSGCEVACAYSGAEALRLAEAQRPEVVLLDVGMSPMSGHETCRLLRRTPWGATPYVVAMTGWGQEEDRARTLEAGFDAHLVKPVDATVLMALLHSEVPPRTRERAQVTGQSGQGA